jgi:hypothetical protein
MVRNYVYVPICYVINQQMESHNDVYTLQMGAYKYLKKTLFVQKVPLSDINLPTYL